MTTNRVHLLALDSGETFRVSPDGRVLTVRFNRERTEGTVQGNLRDAVTLRMFILRYGVMVVPTDPDRRRGASWTMGEGGS